MKQLNDETGYDYKMGYKDGGNYVLEQLLEKIMDAILYNSDDEAEEYWPAHREVVQTAIENTYSQVADWARDILEELKDETK